jgi:hemerythrin superfamily protein
MDPEKRDTRPPASDIGAGREASVMAWHGGTVIDELTSDHREVEEIFTHIETLPPGSPERRVCADQAVALLMRHSAAEEAYLYPAVREFVLDGDALADKEIADHAAVERLAAQIDGLPAAHPELDGVLAELIREVRAHVADEEGRLFPLLAAAVSEEKLLFIGDKVRLTSNRAPTHPHPSAPHSPTAQKLLGPALRIADRIRDAAFGRVRGPH